MFIGDSEIVLKTFSNLALFLFSFSKFKTIFTRFPAVFSIKTKKFCFYQNFVFKKSNRFQSSKQFLFVFQQFFTRYQFENENLFVFTKISLSKSNHFQMFQNNFFRFPAVFSMKRNKFSFSPKFRFQNLIFFKCFKTIFPFSCHFMKFQNGKRNSFVAVIKSKTPSQKLKCLPK